TQRNRRGDPGRRLRVHTPRLPHAAPSPVAPSYTCADPSGSLRCSSDRTH
ncbi:hypothetical protein KUCAC02_035015, partial [Chaenocephalus aceratus]